MGGMVEPLLQRDEAGLCCPTGGFHIDPWRPVARAVITHAHADHARPGSEEYLAAREGAEILRHRLGAEAQIRLLDWGEKVRLGGMELSLHPAGHIRGSAQVRIEGSGQVWVVTGDFKRAPDPTCAPFQPLRCDVLISEATFALPLFRWPEDAEVLAAILDWVTSCGERGRAAVLFAYSLGKAQRLLAALAGRLDRPVLVHGAIAAINRLYQAEGVALGAWEPLPEPRHRQALAGRLILAPPSASASWLRTLGPCETACASGWMRIRGQRRRRGYDRGFVLSDHADWPALLATIRESGARRVLLTHGHGEALARYLCEQGLLADTLATAYEGEGE